MAIAKRAAGRVAVGLLLLVVTCTALIGARSAIEIHNIAEGARHGFPLTGTYHLKMPDSSYDLSFWEEEDGSTINWGVRRAPAIGGEVLCHGAALPTPDPNVYILCDDAGSKVGIAHLAYVDDESRGSLFIGSIEDSFIEFQRQGSVPIRMIT
ncbi:hypothetical protein [uncultured Adlercreutzia sp.]|uniref:hypothetical protein n=1 Tax=uncultured Adlercreutzia sp. TaxID=875803 RepID=UPI0025D3F6C0|nr:hypothetical protein [uncultured Adlercreutzia sp.]